MKRLTGWVLLAGMVVPLLGAATAAPRGEQVLDVEMFKRELERSHALATKKDKNYRKQLKKLEKITRSVPAFPGPWLALARLEEAAGNPRQAEKDYLSALQVSDRWAGPALSYAEYLSGRRKASEAIVLLRTSLSTQPDNPAIAFALAEALQGSAPSESIEIWDRIRKSGGRRFDAAFKAAALEYSRGRWPEAYDRLRSLREGAMQDPEILILAVEAARKAGKAGDASDWRMHHALGSGQCANLATWIQEERHSPLEACRRALERDPRCPEAWFLQAEILEAAGHRDEAFNSYAQAYRLEPEHKIVLSRLKTLAGQLLRPMPDPGPVIKVRDRKNLWAKAEAEMENGNWKKSFSTVKKMPFRHDAEFGRPFLVRMAEVAKGESEILRWADSLAHTIPREGTLIYAAALKGAGRFARADELLRKQVETWTLDPVPCEQLGRLRKEMKLWEAAARAYEEADRRDWRGRWMIEEARCWAENGDWGKAARLYVEELERRPFQPEAYKGLTNAYEKNARPDDALRAARLGAQADPLSREAWEAYRRLLKNSDPTVAEGIDRILREL